MVTETVVFTLIFLAVEIESNPLTNPFIPDLEPQSVLMAQIKEDFKPRNPDIKYTFADYVYKLDEKRKNNANIYQKSTTFSFKIFIIHKFFSY